MGKKSNFQPVEPLFVKKVYHTPAPRAARVLARIFLVVVALLLVTLIIVAFAPSLYWLWNAGSDDDTLLTKLDSYREQDMVNLDAYLRDRGFTPTGTSEEIVYRQSGKTIVIHDMGTMVRIGDDQGNVREYGVPDCYYSYLDDGSVRYESYVCRISYKSDDYGGAGQQIVSAEPSLRDMNIPRAALAEIIRVSYR